MNIRTRFLLLFGILSALFGGGLLLHQWHEHAESAQLQKDLQRQYAYLVRNILELQSDGMAAFATEWAQSDDLASWTRAELLRVLDSNDMDAVWVYDNKGHLVSFTHHPTGASLKDLPQKLPAFGQPPASSHFFVPVPQGAAASSGTPLLAEMRAAPLSRTTGGFLYAAKLWDARQLDRLSHLLNAKVWLTSPPPAGARARRVTYREILKGPEGKAVGHLNIVSRYRGRKNRDTVARHETQIAFLFIATLLILSALCWRRWAGRPLQQLMEALRTGKESALAPLLLPGSGGSAEFHELARLVGDSQRYQQELEAQKKELERSQQRLALHREQAPLGMVEWDADFRIVAWNPAAQAIFGYSRGEILGQNGLDLIVPPSARPAVDQVAQDLLARRTGRGERSINENVTRDGRIILCEWHNTPLVDESGAVIGVSSLVRDITEERRAQEALRESEARFGQLTANMPGMAYQFVRHADGRGVFPFVSEGAVRLFGLSPEAIQEHPALLFDMVHPDDRELLYRANLDAAKPGDYWTLEARFVLPDGEIKWMQMSGRSRAQEDGQIIWDGLLTDITEIREAHQALLRQQEFLRNVIDTSPNLIFVKDADGRFTLANRAMAEAYGVTPAELVGKGDEDFGMPAEIVHAYREADRQTLAAQNQTIVLEEPLALTDGSIRWLHTVKRPIPSPDGTSYQVLGIAADITERKQAEEEREASRHQLRQVLDHANCLLWQAEVREALLPPDESPMMLFDAARKTILTWELHTINEAEALRWLPLERKEGEPFFAAWDRARHPADQADCNQRSHTALVSGADRYTQSFRTIAADGHIHWLQEDVQIEELTEGEEGDTDSPRLRHWRLTGVATDVTERKLAEERLQVLAEELRRSNTALQEFAYVASHDLKEPLRKIQTFGGMLQRKAGDTLAPAGKDYVDRMCNAAARMQTLVEGLLAYSRVSSRPRELAPVDLNHVVAGVLSDLETRVTEGAAQVKVDTLPMVFADELQMRQLFQNLIGNALKFRKMDGSPMLVRVTASLSPDGKWVTLQVSDNGIGFPPQYGERVFNIFERLVPKDTGYEGTGVGLAICKKIVERHGGSIRAIGIPDAGATFEVLLPSPDSPAHPDS